MSRKLISLVQPNFQQGPKEFNAHYLPYSVGVLWAYVNQFDSIKINYQLEDLIWRRDSIEDTANKLAKCSIVGFSTYVWNKNYNYALARRVKELNPNCMIFFGGPELPITKNDIFKKLVIELPKGTIVCCSSRPDINIDFLEIVNIPMSWNHSSSVYIYRL